MSNIKEIQKKILEVMKFIDEVCTKEVIEYFIMGGTALGAIRHKGFIPWDDDLDIFMTIDNYEKFKSVFEKYNDGRFVLQEWRVEDEFLEYAKVRMNNTTFIEEAFKDRKDMHHGIYVDIMILHKCPDNKFIQYMIYLMSKFIVLTGLSQRNWKPKTFFQKLALNVVKILPSNWISNKFFKVIYHYDKTLKDNFKWCYFITKATFSGGVFDKEMFEEGEYIDFEDTKLRAPKKIKEYLTKRYGDYMKLPPPEKIKEEIHAMIADANRDFKEYL